MMKAMILLRRNREETSKFLLPFMKPVSVSIVLLHTPWLVPLTEIESGVFGDLSCHFLLPCSVHSCEPVFYLLLNRVTIQ